MPKIDVGWRFEGGFNQLLKTAAVELSLTEKPVKLSFEVSPFNLPSFQSPILLDLEAGKTLSGQGPLNLKWSIKPNGRMRVLILPPKSAFLGNYRIPRDHYGIQWDIEAIVDSGVRTRNRPFLAEVGANSRVKYSWVQQFSKEMAINGALIDSWRNFINPFRPEEIVRLAEGQVIYWNWTGGLNLRMAIEYGLFEGWRIGKTSDWGSIASILNSGITAQAFVEASKKGSFALRVSKRKNRITTSLIQNRTEIHGGGFQFKFISGHSIQLNGPHKLTQPLLKPIKSSLRDSIHKKLQIAMTVDWKSWTRRRILMKAEWKQSDKNISNEYQKILDGTLPERRDGLKVTGRFDWATKKSKGIQINLFGLYQFSRREEKTDQVTVSVNARGDILLEQKSALEKRRISGGNLELYRIIAQHNDKLGKVNFTWSFEKKDRFSRDRIKKLLTAILRVRSISEFDLPGQHYFPADLNLIWMTDFSNTALDEVRQANDEEVWTAIIQAFQLFEDRFGSLNEDWIKSESLRERINNDPIGAILESKYPIPGRTKVERQIVVSQYRSVLGFLSLMEKWKDGLAIDFREFVSNSFELPVFAFFHILSAPETRRSAVLIVGDFQRGWGDQQLTGV